MENFQKVSSPGYVISNRVPAFAAESFEKTAVRTNQIASGKIGFLYHAVRALMTLSAIVIASCVANSAIHNGAQPPMGSIMLKCAGVLLALFTACVTFGGTASVITSLGMGRAVADISACLPSAYVLYFAFSHP
ncbi:MAG: hypothetical protein LLG04_06050 [Parachlamydia sp.]|nr:hypothetical protein [Parachlamydia sp.]